MPDWLWLRVLAIIAILFSCVPLFNYWHIIFGQRGFNKGTDLLAYTIFESVFNISTDYIIMSNLNLSKENPSFILFFACIQLFLFTSIAAAHPAFYGLTHVINELLDRANFHTITINNKMLKTIVSCYIVDTKIDDRYFLSSEFALIFVLLCYIISGILTVSSIGNGLMVLLTNTGIKIGSSNLKASKEAEAMLAVYNTDLQLYKDLFLLSVVPLAIPQFVHALKKT